MHKIAIPLLFHTCCLYRKSKRLFLLFIGVFILGCSHHIVGINGEEAGKLLPFVKDGTTIKQEVIRRLGRPTESYENGRIIIYLMVHRRGHPLEVFNTENKDNSRIVGTYQLILVFDRDGVLDRHSLVGNR